MGQSPGCTDRTVKYMAKSPAKNMSSLESHTMVPTLTRFGRVSECTRLDSKLDAVAVEVTTALCPATAEESRPGWHWLCRFGGRLGGPVPGPDTIEP
jgi:hypothetical protein